MEGLLLNELQEMLNSKLVSSLIYVVVVGVVALQLKDIIKTVFDYFKLKMSDFGRGTKIKIDGYEGYIERIRLREVEIRVGNSTLLVPIDRFIKISKVIVTNGELNG